MCFGSLASMCVDACECVHLGVHVRVEGNGLICLCILTMFIRTAAVALMRNTFGLILLPHAVETGGGLSEYKQYLLCTHLD